MSVSILVVEDNADNLKLVAWILEDSGYEFVTVASAEAALELLENRRFDLVLMDISLPGMDGKEATQRIRRDPRLKTLPVLALTAHAVPGEREAILEAGVDGILTKPLDEKLLLGVIRELLPIEVAHGPHSGCG